MPDPASNTAQLIHELIDDQLDLSREWVKVNAMPAGTERDLGCGQLNARTNELCKRERELARELPSLQDTPQRIGDRVLVWRIEHPSSGEGPYVSTPKARWLRKRPLRMQLANHLRNLHWRCENRPGVRREFPQFTSACIPHSACASHEDLERWFYGVWRHLAAAGYEVRCYAVGDDDHWVGASGQVVFYKGLAELVEARPMSNAAGDQIAA